MKRHVFDISQSTHNSSAHARLGLNELHAHRAAPEREVIHTHTHTHTHKRHVDVSCIAINNGARCANNSAYCVHTGTAQAICVPRACMTRSTYFVNVGAYSLIVLARRPPRK
jgi:hypothetical protein